MKNLIIVTLIFCFSCQEKQTIDSCVEIERKYDSILSLTKKFKNDPIFRFYSILEKEKGKPVDSLLIYDYKDLIDKDSLLNLYIWDRIHSINQNITTENVYNLFKGTYLLKPNHNKEYAQATKIIIDRDSTYLYKYSKMIDSGRFELINSSDEFVKGKIRMKRFKIRLLDFSAKIVILDDNSCMDCEQLQFYKTK